MVEGIFRWLGKCNDSLFYCLFVGPFVIPIVLLAGICILIYSLVMIVYFIIIIIKAIILSIYLLFKKEPFIPTEEDGEAFTKFIEKRRKKEEETSNYCENYCKNYSETVRKEKEERENYAKMVQEAHRNAWLKHCLTSEEISKILAESETEEKGKA